MTEINLTENFSSDISQLIGLMYFPNDALQRKQYHLMREVNESLKDVTKQSYSLTREKLNLLLCSQSYIEFGKQVSESIKKATIVGDLLNSIYLMEKFNIPEPSLKKAIYIQEQFALTQDGYYGDRSRMKYSHQTIRNYWNEYKSVAHFWGAFRINQAYQICSDSDVFSEKGFIPFLEVAAGLFGFGRNFVPFRQKNNIPLLHGEAWTLPKTISPRELANAQFPDLLVELLKSYKA